MFLDILESVLVYAFKLYKSFNMVSSGHFNVCFLSKETSRLSDLFNSSNLAQTIHEPTRVTKRSSSCVDNIFSNFIYYNESYVITSALSDHYAQSINYNTNFNDIQQAFHLKILFKCSIEITLSGGSKLSLRSCAPSKFWMLTYSYFINNISKNLS